MNSVAPFIAEGVRARPLPSGHRPHRLVLVRLHAFGDTVAVLPVLGALAARFPDCRLEVVTGPDSAELFQGRADVAAVHILDARAGRAGKLRALAGLAARLRRRRPDAILDLQRSRLSRALTLLTGSQAHAAFDRFAPRHGLDRYLDAAEALGLGRLAPVLAPCLRPELAERAAALLDGGGHRGEPLVCLNPAGGWPTKQWALERYAELGRRLHAELGARLLLLGAGAQGERVSALAEPLGTAALDLVGRTTPGLAMALVARASLMVSDDSALMHLAWVQGVPTLALFGATRATWCRPLGERAAGFYSEDLPCGACMSAVCARGDVHCLDRVSVDDALARARTLLTR